MLDRNHTSEPSKRADGMKMEESGNTQCRDRIAELEEENALLLSRLEDAGAGRW
jgi:hypothetical protein